MSDEASLQDKKATGGKIALGGFDFQRNYALVKLIESIQAPEFSAILIEGAEDVETRFELQDKVERCSYQVKNHLVKISEVKEIITNFEKLYTDSPDTWKSFVIACTQIDDKLKVIHNKLEDYRQLNSTPFYSDGDKILTNTRDQLESQISDVGLPARFVMERVYFEPDLLSFAKDEWVKSQVLGLLQSTSPDINHAAAEKIYYELHELISTSTRRPIARAEVEEIIIKHRLKSSPLEGQKYIFQAPQIKDNYVPRPRETKKVVDLLTGEGTGAGPRKVAVYGMPGSGKSALAIAVAHVDAIKQSFPDGVLWTTLGQEPNLVGILSSWVQALGDYQFKSSEPQAILAHLNTLLQEKAILTIVDDAWQAEEAKLAVIGGPRCAVLLTSREVGIAKAADVSPEYRYEIPVMEEGQALQLLAGGQDRSLDEREHADAQAIAHALGYLPLALELASAQTQGEYPLTWRELRSDFEQEIARLESLDDSSLRDLSQADQRKRFSLVSSITLSLRRLAPPDLEKYAWLGVLPDDADLRVGMAATLWEVDERQARDELLYFRDKALLSLGDHKGDAPATYRLHDTLHDMAKRLLVSRPEPGDEYSLPGLGLTLTEAHEKILERYRQKLANGKWHTLPDDGYILQHLAWHLEKAGQFSELQELFADDAWLQVRVASDGYQYSGYLADLGRAWQSAYQGANAQIEADQPLTQLVECIHLALIRTSINSLASNYVPQIVARAVELKLTNWTPERAYLIGAQIPDVQKRFEMLNALLNIDEEATGLHLDNKLKRLVIEQALQAALAIEDERLRAEALSRLAGKLEGEQRHLMLEEALQAALAIEDERPRAGALSRLAAKLDGEQVEQVLQTALTIEHEWSRARVLNGLAAKLEGEQVERALQAALAIGYEGSRAEALSGLAVKLEGEQRHLMLEEALQAALAIKDEGSRAEALSGLAGKLEGEQRHLALEQGLQAVQAIKIELYRAWALSGLAANLEGELVEQALQAALEIWDKRSRAEALSGLAVKLEGEQRQMAIERALQAALAIEDERYRAEALKGLAGKLEGEQVEQVLQTALVFRDEKYRAEALSEVATKLEVEQRQTAIWQALKVALAIEDEESRYEALSEVAMKLEGEPRQIALDNALEAAMWIKDERFRAQALSGLAGKLEREQRQMAIEQALQAALAFETAGSRARILNGLAAKLAGEQVEQALQAALAFENEGSRAYALSGLAAKLDGEQVERALQAALAIEVGWSLARALSGLAAKLDGEQVERALQAALAIEDRSYRARALSGLAEKLDGEQVEQALQAALTIEDERSRAEALSGLAGKLAGEQVEQALRAALAIKNGWFRARVLSRLADRLEDPSLSKKVYQAIPALFADGLRSDRSEIFGILAYPNLITAKMLRLEQADYAIIADSIIAITEQWHWL